MNDYTIKNMSYFSNTRNDLIQYVPKKENQKILEVGAGTCDTLLTLKKDGYASYVVGIELMNIENSSQNNPDIDNLIIGNIEDLDLMYEEFFDVVILGDILEHLVDPWTVVNKLNKSLKLGGIIVASIPNFLYYKNLKTIVLDADFKYEESGILDRTHLRFFCKKNILSLFEQASLDVLTISSSFDQEKGKKYLLSKIFKGLHKFFVMQYYIVAIKKNKKMDN